MNTTKSVRHTSRRTTSVTVSDSSTSASVITRHGQRRIQGDEGGGMCPLTNPLKHHTPSRCPLKRHFHPSPRDASIGARAVRFGAPLIAHTLGICALSRHKWRFFRTQMTPPDQSTPPIEILGLPLVQGKYNGCVVTGRASFLDLGSKQCKRSTLNGLWSSHKLVK